MIRAYVDLASQPARAVYMFLKYTKIPHEIVPIALRKGEHLGEDYAKINPLKLVPAIDDGGFKLNDSVAIMQYLSDKYVVDEKLSLYPKDLQARAKINAFNNWQNMNIRLGGAGTFLSLVIKPLMNDGVLDQKDLDQSLKILKAALKKLETVFLKDTPFIYSDRMTFADLLGVAEVMQPKMGAGVDVLSDFPKVTAWVEAVKSTVGLELFNEAHKMIGKIGDNYVKKSKFPTPKL